MSVASTNDRADLAERGERSLLHRLLPNALSGSLWVAQAVAALALGRDGLMMLTRPVADRTGLLGPWATNLPASTLHALGFVALAGAFGIVAPSLVRIAPKLAPLTAAAFALVLAVAALLHGVRGELGPLAVDAALLGAMLFVAWGRTFKSPIEPHAHIRC